MKILLIDIETAPHVAFVWGLFDQNINLDRLIESGYTLCWSAKWFGDDEILFGSLQEDGKKKMLRRVHELLEQADAVVHYNGQRFDIPTLNQEFVTIGLAPPAPFKQIDLYKTAKRQFRLPSNKLDYVAKYLGLQGKMKHKGMDLWKGCMARDPASWQEMKEYNLQDVRVLEQVYIRLIPWVINHPNHNLYTGVVEPVCPSCGGKHLHKRGLAKTSTMVYQRMQCQGCGAWSRTRTNDLPKEKKAAIIVQDRG